MQDLLVTDAEAGWFVIREARSGSAFLLPLPLFIAPGKYAYPFSGQRRL